MEEKEQIIKRLENQIIDLSADSQMLHALIQTGVKESQYYTDAKLLIAIWEKEE